MYPFWLDFDDKTNKFMMLEEKVKLVQRIFNMAETMGAKKSITYLKKKVSKILLMEMQQI